MLYSKLFYLENKKILIFDIETTGLPITKNGFNIGFDNYFDFKDNSKYNTSRIVEIAWKFIPKYNLKILNNNIHVYKRMPIDFNKIDPIALAIHKISIDDIQKNGILLEDIIEDKGLGKAIIECDYILAHNTAFNVSILCNELQRLEEKKFYNKLIDLITNNKIICIGELSKDICKIQSNQSNQSNQIYYKMPKLVEIYQWIYRILPKALNAKGDVSTIIECIIAITRKFDIFEELNEFNLFPKKKINFEDILKFENNRPKFNLELEFAKFNNLNTFTSNIKIANIYFKM